LSPSCDQSSHLRSSAKVILSAIRVGAKVYTLARVASNARHSGWPGPFGVPVLANVTHARLKASDNARCTGSNCAGSAKPVIGVWKTYQAAGISTLLSSRIWSVTHAPSQPAARQHTGLPAQRDTAADFLRRNLPYRKVDH
jgi:hypothetical protein